MGVNETREKILTQIYKLVLKVGNCVSYDVDTKVSEQVKNLAIAYRLLKEDE